MQKIIMKLTKIFGIVLSLHVGVILLVMFQPSCQTADKKNMPASEVGNVPQETPINDFNQGTDIVEKPTEEVFVAPTRPKPGEIIIPGNDIIVPQPEPVSPSPLALDPTASPLRPTDVNIYKVVRGDTLWGIARKNSITLSSLLASNPNLNKSSKLSIGQEIMIPSGGGSSTPTPAIVPQATVTTEGAAGTYIVKSGDSLSRIARNNQVSLSSLMEVNGMNSRSIIRPGQTLILPGASSIAVPSTTKPTVVPPGATTHVVKKGENLTRIAGIYGVSIAQIMSWNGLTDAGKIRVGQSLVVSGSNSNATLTENISPPAKETNNVPDVTEPAGDDSLQNFFKGTTEDRPLIDAPDSPN
jgi:LysM repeat protein